MSPSTQNARTPEERQKLADFKKACYSFQTIFNGTTEVCAGAYSLWLVGAIAKLKEKNGFPDDTYVDKVLHWVVFDSGAEYNARPGACSIVKKESFSREKVDRAVEEYADDVLARLS